MRTENFSFLSADKTTRIHAVKWLPEDGRYHSILQITHGMVEYIERYEPFARYLTWLGFMVVGHDHVGHGQSVAFKGDWGFFREKDPDQLLVEDCHKLYTMIRMENPDLPYFFFGHSMGSFVLRKYLALYSEGLSGAIICGTGFMPALVTTGGLTLVEVMTRIFGSRHRSRLVTGMTFGKSYARFDMTGKHPENSWLTKRADIVTKYYSTPACTFTFTLNGYKGLLKMVHFVCRRSNIQAIPQDLPIYIVSGADDPVGEFGIGPSRLLEELDKTGHKDVQMKIYENDRHEILNETDADRVFEDIYYWMMSKEKND